MRYQTELAQNVAALKEAGVEPRPRCWKRSPTPIAELSSALADLKKALDRPLRDRAERAATRRRTRASLLPAMDAVRAAADALEGVVADDLWPLPTYQEMLYIL